MDEGVEGVRAARTERTRVNGHKGDVLGSREGRLGEGWLGEGRLDKGRLGETAPRSGQHGVGVSNGKRLRADARSTQQRLLGGGILGEEGSGGLLGEGGLLGGEGGFLSGREGGFLSGGLLGGGNGGFEVAVDADVDVLIETGIGLETGFRFGATFDDMEIMMEETESPFDAFRGVVVFEGVSEFLSGFDEFAVSYTGCRPRLGKMVRIELVQAAKTGNTTDDDVFAVFLTLLVGVHHSAVIIDAVNRV